MGQKKLKIYSDTREELLDQIGGEEMLDSYKTMNPRKMKLSLWIWLHPSAYSLIYWGIPSCALFQSALCFVIRHYWNHWIINALAWVFFVIGIISLIVQINGRQANKGLTLFEKFIGR